MQIIWARMIVTTQRSFGGTTIEYGDVVHGFGVRVPEGTVYQIIVDVVKYHRIIKVEVFSEHSHGVIGVVNMQHSESMWANMNWSILAVTAKLEFAATATVIGAGFTTPERIADIGQLKGLLETV